MFFDVPRSSSSRSSSPPRPIAPCVDVNERSVPGPGWIDACPADELGMGGFHPVYSGLDDFAVSNSDVAVMVEVVHDTVVVAVQKDVRGIPEHVPAECGTSLGVAAAGVVLRGAEAAHDADAADVNTVRGKVLKHKLELVDELELQDKVLGPDVWLIMREKVAELEVLRDVGVRGIWRDLNEPGRIRVARGRCLGRTDAFAPRPLGRPITDVVEADFSAVLGVEGELSDDVEVGDRLDGVPDGECDAPDARAMRLRVGRRDIAASAVAQLGARRERVGLDVLRGGVDRCTELSARSPRAIEE